ncbi:MAG TPA: PAS domain-containing sensor histidine kinase [Aliiroseovarius sp.]|nr:PAS domain-containing sensor histidine kinase [Aliiroseovarius sp.]
MSVSTGSSAHPTLWDNLAQLRRSRRAVTIARLMLVVLAPVLALATYLVFGPLDQGAQSPALRIVLLMDMVYVLLVAAMVIARIASMVAARRRQSAGSRLHLRLTAVFALLALIPTVLVAVFAVLTVNVGLEGWFSDRVSSVVGNSLSAAVAYEDEHRQGLIQDAQALARYLDRQRATTRLVPDSRLRQFLSQGQAQIQRGLREAYVINSDGEIRLRGDGSYLFDYEAPTPEEIARAMQGETVIIEDWDHNEFRALIRLNNYPDHLLYVSRDVDGKILSLLDETKETVTFYRQVESDRGQILFEFGLIYLGFAVILILAAVLLGMWFAERLAGPIGRLAGAAQQVGAGDLDVVVEEAEGDDEIAMLGRMFNQMTRQIRAQRDALVENSDQIERRRRLFDSVLSSVTAGVIGLDPDGTVTVINKAAQKLLALDEDAALEQQISLLVPEFTPLLARLKEGRGGSVLEELHLTRRGKQENLLVRMAERRSAEGVLEGYVIAFDDVTDLVSAQRLAAWGDVARRIAHEIKNPLTPIQLSAERIRRKFARASEEEEAGVSALTDVIIRQTNDLRRIVDEFSKFARMPEPERRPTDLTRLVADAALLQEAGQDGVDISTDLPDHPVELDIDPTMIGQALTNLIKNAVEATQSYRKKHPEEEEYKPRVKVALDDEGGVVRLRIADNGIGLPPDRARLFEPYVTTRSEGTGLGLPIVKKIIEEHGGSMELLDAPPFAPGAHQGAMAVIYLPVPDPAAPRRAQNKRGLGA